MMTAQFRKEWRELQATAHGRPINEIVTLASLVEKETGRAEDRPIVASVYQNRLRKGMTLDCDPTTIYAALLEARYRGTIYRSDLAVTTRTTHTATLAFHPDPSRIPAWLRSKPRSRPPKQLISILSPSRMVPAATNSRKQYEQHDVAVQQYRRATKP